MDRTVSSTSSMTLAELKKVESYQYPRTHLGHLNEEQAKALAEFKEIAAKEGYYKPDADGAKASHDDETLLRYVRARKFSPPQAFKQFKDTEDWRKKNKIEELYDTIDIAEYEETRKLYPQWIGRRDKRGIPVYVFEVAPLTSKRMAAYDKVVAASGNSWGKTLTLFALFENLTKFVLPLCSAMPNRAYPETPVSQSCNIVDISKVGIKQFWNLKAHMQDSSQLSTAYYPECLDRIFIIGAPSFFPTVWSWIKRWFDPITVSKIFILGQAEIKPTLLQYMDIEDIPKKYGGNLDWEWEQLPNLQPDIVELLQWQNPDKDIHGKNNFPIGPVRFREAENGDLETIAVGSVHGKPRETVVAVIKAETQAELAHLEMPIEGEDPHGAPLSGIHTHPPDDQEYFPKTGNTPTEELEEPAIDEIKDPGLGASSAAQNNTKANAGAPREGTSETRFAQQEHTLAAGKLAEGTPAVVEPTKGDKVTVMEPSTVGQAPKDVSVPQPDPPAEQGSLSYFGQAKAAAGAVVSATTTAASAVGGKVMSVAGYGGQEDSTTEGAEDNKENQTEGGVAEDSRVDGMSAKDVEDFVRSQNESKAPQPA